LLHLLHVRHPLASAKNLARETVKIALGRNGHPRWEMYAANRTYRAAQLRDGRRICEFLRSNPFWGGSGRGDTADGIAEVLSERMLNRVVQRGGTCILYTHLGKVRDPRRPFGPATQAAFARLAEFQQRGQILVRSTHRLLRYLTVRDHLRFDAARQGQAVTITARSVEDPVTGIRAACAEELEGLTFVVPRCERVELALADGGTIRPELVHTGSETRVVVPWRELELPPS